MSTAGEQLGKHWSSDSIVVQTVEAQIDQHDRLFYNHRACSTEILWPSALFQFTYVGKKIYRRWTLQFC